MLKTAIENAGSTEREDIKNALKEIKIEGSFPGGSEIILPYDTIEFTDVEMNGQKHTNTNASATLTILQIQDGAYKTVWPMDIADAEIQYPATYE